MDEYCIPVPTPGSDRDCDNRFYDILGGGAKFSLLEGFIDLNLPEVMGANKGPLTAGELCAQLQLDEHRGWKFLHDLSLCGFLVETDAQNCDMATKFSLSEESKLFFGEDGTHGYFYRELVIFQRYVKDLKIPLVDTLRGATLPDMVKWPPQTPEAAHHLETWMSMSALCFCYEACVHVPCVAAVSAKGAIQRLVDSDCLDCSKKILDVGGGDGTIAISLVKEHLPDDVHITVYNLPASAELARDNVEYYECSTQVTVTDGNFLEDEDFVGPFDTIMFNRV